MQYLPGIHSFEFIGMINGDLRGKLILQQETITAEQETQARERLQKGILGP